MLTEKEIEHIAALARIKLDTKTKEKYRKELSSILDYVAKLNRVNTEDVEPLQQVSGISNASRRDELTDRAENKDLLVPQAPSKESNFVKVKRVFENPKS